MKGEIVQRKVDKAAGKFVFNAEVGNFSRLSALNSGIRRPGDEGQKAIAARQIGLDQQSLEKRIYRDDRLSRYFGSKVGRQQVNVRPFAIGGLVNGSGAGDTTPALLTRGEFVMNRGAVSRLGANNVQRLADGGAVAPVSGQPGSSSGDGGFVSAAAQLVKSLGGFDESAQRLSQTFGAFNNSARELAQALNNMPKTLTITANHTVNVNHNGAEVFAKLTPAIEQMVKDGVDSAVTRAFNAKFPDAGVNLG